MTPPGDRGRFISLRTTYRCEETMSTTPALDLRDLTDPTAGDHAVQDVVRELENALTSAWLIPVRRHHVSRVVTVADNYDRLRYSPHAATRDRRYTRYLGGGLMLRSHTTAHIPALLEDIAAHGPDDVLLSVPGLCYRRDVIDRQHVGEPHQIDLWRIRRRDDPLTEDDLEEMIRLIVTAILPHATWRTVGSEHPYTTAGREIHASTGASYVEIGECGLAHPEILAAAGLPAAATGLAMGLGLDRLVMLVKGIDDIRLLRSADPRISAQLADLSPYRPVSMKPAALRDVSVAVPADLDAELLGDRVRAALGPDAAAVEEIAVLSETGYDDLPEIARARLGMAPGQRNVLLRVVLRHLDRTLTSAEANQLRDRILLGIA